MYATIALIAALTIMFLTIDRKKIGMKLRIRKYARTGVVFLHPETVYIEKGVKIGRGTIIHPNVNLYRLTTIGQNCTIYSGVNLFETRIKNNSVIWPNVSMYAARIGVNVQVHSHNRIVRSTVRDDTKVSSYCLIKDSQVEEGCKLGPNAYIHGYSWISRDVEVANIEIVRSSIGKGTRAKHGRYIGDAKIGENCNIGAGTVFCNYDGSKKHKTILEDDVFVGSGSMLIAPLTLGKESFIAAGSVVARDVPGGALIIDRGQVHKHHPDSGKGEGRATRPDYVTRDKDGWHLK